MKPSRNDYAISNGKMYIVCENYSRKELRKDYGDDVPKSKFSAVLFMCSMIVCVSLLVSVMSLTIVFSEESVAAGVSKFASDTKVVDIESLAIDAYELSSDNMDFAVMSAPPAIESYEMIELTDEVVTDEMLLEESIGNSLITLTSVRLIRYDLPDIFYGSTIDYSSFQPWMDFRKITNTASKGYAVCNAEEAYTDSNGFRRYAVSDDEFSVNDADDYIVAMGTFYKPSGTIGNRYLIVTENGMFTVRTGDEKADADTDSYNMFTVHGNEQAGILEFIVDTRSLDSKVESSGNAVKCESFTELSGEILHIYRIE